MSDEPKLNMDFREIGQTGLKRFSGFVQEEFLNELAGQKGIKVFREMGDNDPVVGAILLAIDLLCRQVPWHIKAASSQPADVEAKDFLESCKDDMSNPFSDVVSEALTMVRYGHAPLELVYKRRAGADLDPMFRSKHSDGRVGWRKMPLRSQDTIYRWVFDDNGGLRGLEQQAPPDYSLRTIPIEKLLLFRTSPEKNNPEGKSILRTAYRPWFFKKHIETIEGIGIERDLAGLPVAGVPPEILSSAATPNQKAQLEAIKKIVTNIRRDEQEGVVFPLAYNAEGKELYSLKLMTTGGSRQFDTDKIIQRYDQRIAMTALADFLLIGHGGSSGGLGGGGLTGTKMDLFTAALGAFLGQIKDVMNRFAVPRLFGMNDFKVTDYPTFEHGELANIDLDKLGNYIQKLSGAGYPLFPNVPLEKYLAEAAKLPTPEQEAYAQNLEVGDTAGKGGANPTGTVQT